MPRQNQSIKNIIIIGAVAAILLAIVALVPNGAAMAQGNAPLGITPTATAITSEAGPAIPEPTTITLVGLGLAGLVGVAFKRRAEDND